MANYQLTNLAVQDLTDIWNYTFDHWSEQQADVYYQQLVNGFELITSNQNIGRNYDGVIKDLYGFKVNRHIIFYRVITKELVEVTRILHEQMELKTKLE
ncbi:type II toxin-antitoxin system RelE/ParE family toxin [Marinoscillum sp.]|uniref:type II toxin-antitoxin system RelE/ParE family toxin n=1 Tax=Marinoscillum sp. TaxID=2024838 RepID=UPI003BAA0BBE